jgi:hypothetical protein
MNREDIIRMAREAGFTDADDDCVWITDGTWDKELRKFAELIAAAEREACIKLFSEQLERFANLVAAAEREACAALCDKISDDDGFEGGYADNCAKAIRARGQQ